MDMEDNPLCAKCGIEETAIHLITECPGYVGLRIATLGRPIVQEDSIREYPIYKISLQKKQKDGRLENQTKRGSKDK